MHRFRFTCGNLSKVIDHSLSTTVSNTSDLVFNADTQLCADSTPEIFANIFLEQPKLPGQ